MTTEPEPAYYAAWSEALRVVDYWRPLQTRGVGNTPEDAVRHAERICINWYDTRIDSEGRGREEWEKHLNTLHVWAVYYVWDVYPGVLKTDDPLGMKSAALPGLVVRGIAASLYPGIADNDKEA